MHPSGILLHLGATRDRLGLTLREVEERTAKAISKSWLQRAEADLCAIPVHKLLSLANTYNISPHVLVEYVDWPVPKPCTCPCHSQREG